MLPLMFLGEKKELYFTGEEMALYESALRPYVHARGRRGTRAP